ncbi:heterokaryon incompatibility protein-domain-containing protein [Boeremia exigua]|uniref:heterokaryon incompatibility protein-domain-containing protein n=1 Tax=Boeremia exigua TaxID=749465 RepID=UPI001E8EA013|nr:heterokaryon incompatibility protein-domain-containing protein [Boeremia exigua]KAH6625900.1 heterokaryon incompatibility protein-domain-containing protein [Boeremia exigua]
MSSQSCSHVDVREFDGLRSCLGCGETRFHEPSLPTEAARQEQEYIYTDLRCLQRGQMIRLLVLEPGDYDDPIQCTLILSGLQHAEYEAVSYTWATENGDDSKSQSLKIDNSVFYVTKNCDAALRCLRKRQIRRLWLDALCVNQENINERNHQVGLMDQIYRNAVRVHVCIQDHLQDHSICMRWLNAKEGFPELPKHVADRFVDLFALRYFGRVWVIQEVVMAKSVIFHVNNDVAEWSKEILATLNWRAPPLINAFLQRDGFQNVADALRTSVSSFCSDPRDGVHGIISLLPPHLRTLIPVNYSLQTEETFANAVFACIRSTHSLDVLHFVSLDGNEPNLTLARSFTMAHLQRYLGWTACGPGDNRDLILFNDEHEFLTSFNFDQDGPPTQNQTSSIIALPKHRVDVRLIAGQILPCLKIRALLIDISTGVSSRYIASCYEEITSSWNHYMVSTRQKIAEGFHFLHHELGLATTGGSKDLTLNTETDFPAPHRCPTTNSFVSKEQSRYFCFEKWHPVDSES